MTDWMNRVTKWRTVLASWQLGTRSDQDEVCRAVKDHRELSIIMRAEINAITSVLVGRGICTIEEFRNQLQTECRLLDEAHELRFPGFKTTDKGLVIDTKKAAETTRGWPA